MPTVMGLFMGFTSSFGRRRHMVRPFAHVSTGAKVPDIPCD
jgi:hypothetical protein